MTYTDSGRTLLLRYRLEPADRQHVGNAGRTSRVQRTLALLGALYPTERSTKRLAWLARFGPDFLESRWVEPAFVERYITSSLAEAGYAESFDRNWTSTLLRLRKGTVTIRYQTGSTAIFAKFFRDAGSGLRAHGALAALWRAGFRTGEPHRVPEPFAYAPAHRLLLMGGAEGTDVRNALGRRTSDPARIGRQAARWLVKLHSTALTGDCTDARNAVARDIQVVLRTSAQVWREHSPVAARILALAGDWAERRARGDVVTNVHGDFKPEHVFVTDNSTTVIDLDQMLVAHPAADVATFLWQLRSNLWRDGPSAQAVALARAFLEEYASCLPGHLDTLPFYWGLETLASLERSTAGLAAGPVFDSCVAFHLNEFDRSRKLLLEFESRDR